jgi:hypothetical protein
MGVLTSPQFPGHRSSSKCGFTGSSSGAFQSKRAVPRSSANPDFNLQMEIDS